MVAAVVAVHQPEPPPPLTFEHRAAAQRAYKAARLLIPCGTTDAEEGCCRDEAQQPPAPRLSNGYWAAVKQKSDRRLAA